MRWTSLSFSGGNVIPVRSLASERRIAVRAASDGEETLRRFALLAFHGAYADNERDFSTGDRVVMAMVVECESCRSLFRLSVSLLKESKEVRFRCRKCGGSIIVRNPYAPPQVTPPIGDRAPLPIAPLDAPPAVFETGFPPIGDSAPEGLASPVPRDRRAEAADLSEMIRIGPAAGFDDGIVVSPTPNAVSDPPDLPGRKALRLEELFIHPSDVEGDRIPGEGDDGPMVVRPPGPGGKPLSRRPLYRRPLFLAVAVSILLLAGSTFYFVDGNSVRKSSESVVPAGTRSIPGTSVFDVGNVKGYFKRKTSGESYYVVKGTVTNIGKALSNGIRIEATLLGKDNQAIVENGTFAGNVIDESLIPHMSRVRIEGYLGMQHGEGDVNRDIPAGKTLPFMVVFFDPPEGVESFRVKAVVSKEAERIDSPDGKEPDTGASKQ
jgi:hypothetical protein